jgi:signal peptide peptidase SppA
MNLQAELSGHPWAMQPEAFESLIRSAQTTAGPITRPAPVLGKKRVEGGVAIIDITGMITPRLSIFNMLFGGTDVQTIQRELDDALADSSISKIVLNIDSPGGAVTGISDLADQVYKARSIKPIEAHVPGMAASAAYWIASATSRITMADTASVGSIGVVGTVLDNRVWQGMQGITLHEIVSSNAPKKRPDPLTPEGRAVLQNNIDSIASVFTAKVAQYRGVSEKTVNADFGQGGIVIGAAAVRAGLADAIGSFETLLGAPGAIDNTAQAAAAPAQDDSPEAQWQRDPNLRAEFGSLEVFEAYTKANQAGRIRVLGSKDDAVRTVVTGAGSPASPGVTRRAAPGSAASTVEAQCAAQWSGDPEIRAEFGTLEVFTAYTRAERAGIAKTIEGRVVGGR